MAGPSPAFGKIDDVKSPSRLPILVAGLAGVLLIALGLFLSRGDSVATSSEVIGPAGDPLGLSFPEPRGDRLSQPKRAGQPASSLTSVAGQGQDLANTTPATVVVELFYAADNAPAAGAQVSVWREQTGEGAAFRPARRISQTQTDGEGIATLTAGPHQLLEVYAQAAGAGPIARLRLGSLKPEETKSVRIKVERPPAPMDLTVRDHGSGEPVAGAAIRIVMDGQVNLGLEEFPGTAKLVQRTDGDGLAALEGPVRNGKWLLVDAAGYSPTAMNLRMLDGIGAPEVLLVPAARIEVLVLDGAGEPLKEIEVQLVAQLGGFRSTFTAVTNQRGEASLPRVPADVPLVPHVGPVGEVPTLFNAITLTPGEEHALELSL